MFVNNRYRCPEHPPCGEHPNCVVGRKGANCSQPDVQPCSCEFIFLNIFRHPSRYNIDKSSEKLRESLRKLRGLCSVCFLI